MERQIQLDEPASMRTESVRCIIRQQGGKGLSLRLTLVPLFARWMGLRPGTAVRVFMAGKRMIVEVDEDQSETHEGDTDGG